MSEEGDDDDDVGEEGSDDDVSEEGGDEDVGYQDISFYIIWITLYFQFFMKNF